MMDSTVKFYLCLLMILSESFHVLSHLNVMFRISPPTLNQLKAKGYYFLFDGSSFFLSYLLHGRYLPLVSIETLAHLWYVYNWNSNYYANRIRDWSVKEYSGKWITVDWFLTWSDIITHVLMVYQLSLIVVNELYYK